MQENNKLKFINAEYTAMQCSFMMSLSAILGFSVVLLESRSFSSFQIGIILALESIVSIFSQSFLGSFADKNKKIPLKNILLVIVGISFIANLLLIVLPPFFTVVTLIFILIGMTEYSATSLINALAMQFVNKGIPINFGLARGLGSLAYAVAGYSLGKISNTFGAEMILPIHGLFLVIVMITIFFLHKPEQKSTVRESENEKTAITDKEKSEKEAIVSIWVILKTNRLLALFLLSTILIFISHACLSNFLPKIITNVGGNSGDYGTAMSLAAISEIPTMVFFSVILRKISSNKLVVISFFFFFIKSFLFLTAGNVGTIFIFQMLQIAGYGLFVPASVYFVNEIVKDSEKVTGQSLLNIASMGIGITIGNFMGGMIISLFGIKELIALSTVCAFFGFLITAIVSVKLYKKSSVRI